MSDEQIAEWVAAAGRAAAGELDAVPSLAGHVERWETDAGQTAASSLARSPYFTDLIDALLDGGAPPSVFLVAAAESAGVGVVRRLLERGADPNCELGAGGVSGQTALMHARDAETAALLIEHGADPRGGRYLTMSNVHAVAHAGRLDVLKLLERHGCDLDADSANFDGASTPLMVACFSFGFEVPRYLVSRGVDLARRSRKNGKTALHFAIERGQLQIARLLVEKGAPLDAVSKTGATPLHAAIAKGKAALGMAAFLIDQGAPLDAQDAVGITPLMLALTKKQPKLVRHLVARGADLDLALTKAKKVGKEKLEPGSTARDVAAALGLEGDLDAPEERTFAKEQSMLFRDMPPLDPPDDAPVVREAPAERWGARFWETFGDLPDGIELADDGVRNRLRSMAKEDLNADRIERLREQVLAATKHELSRSFLSLYASTFDVRVRWRPSDGSTYPSANFRIYAPEEMFFGPNLSRPKKRFDAHLALRFPSDLQKELKKLYLVAAEEYGETLLSIAGGEERLSFMLASDRGRIVPMTVSFPEYLDALLTARGMHGWQGYFLAEPRRDASFETELARLFGDAARARFLALADA